MSTSISSSDPSRYVERDIKLRKTRRLPVDGSILVNLGEEVEADDIVARSEVAVPAVRLNLVEMLDLKTGDDASRYLLKSPGDSVRTGEEIARKKGLLGRGDRVCTSPIEGKVIAGPAKSGEVLIAPPAQEFELEALITGSVVDIVPQRGVVVEGVGDFIQCLACLGGETQGAIRIAVDDPGDLIEAEAIDESYSGNVLVAGSIDGAALRTALFMGVRAVVVGSITPTTFRWLRDNHQPVTVMITEGFGAMPMARDTFDLLAANEGRSACVLAPDDDGFSAAVFIPTSSANGSKVNEIEFDLGSTVRIARGHSFGVQARVIELPTRRRILNSGVRTQIVRLTTEEGQELVVGRSNVELIG